MLQSSRKAAGTTAARIKSSSYMIITLKRSQAEPGFVGCALLVQIGFQELLQQFIPVQPADQTARVVVACDVGRVL